MKLHSALTRGTRLLSLSLLIATPACNALQKKTDEGASSADSKKDKSAEGEEAAKDPSASSCDDLAKKLCAETGAESQTCAAANTAIPLLAEDACRAGVTQFASTKTKLKARSGKCDELIEALCSKLGKETETCKMVTEQTRLFQSERCVGMLEHVDEIVADLQKQAEAERIANQPLDAEAQAAISGTDAPSFGPANAKVTVVEFSDFECPYCSRAAEVTSQVKEKYGDKVRFVFRQFPLSFHKNAQGAAEASLAAHAQGKFWEFHDKMFENQRALDRSSLESYAADLGLNVTKFKEELDGKNHADRVKDDLEIGNKVAVQGTPTMFVNGKRVPNPTDFAAVASAIDEALGS